jgi:hypothetical protein
VLLVVSQVGRRVALCRDGTLLCLGAVVVKIGAVRQTAPLRISNCANSYRARASLRQPQAIDRSRVVREEIQPPIHYRTRLRVAMLP